MGNFGDASVMHALLDHACMAGCRAICYWGPDTDSGAAHLQGRRVLKVLL